MIKIIKLYLKKKIWTNYILNVNKKIHRIKYFVKHEFLDSFMIKFLESK